MKILCILLPHFPLQCETACRPELKDRQVIITRTAASQKMVMDFSPPLSKLQSGMPLQSAISLYGEAELIRADVPCYQAAFGEILDALETCSPLVEGAAPGEVYLGLDGLQLIYETDDAAVSAVRAVIPSSFEAVIGIAEGKFPAMLAAQHSTPGSYRVLNGDLKTFLRELSCDLLPVERQIKEKLHEFGLHTLGQVAELEVGPLQAQFGPEGKRIRQLANGIDKSPLIMVAIETMLNSAFTKFEKKGLVVRSIDLSTKSWLGEHWERAINFKEPALHVKTVLSRVKLILETNPQPGPTEHVSLKITGLCGQRGRQKSLFTEVRAQEHLLNDIKQLEFRLGGTQLYKIKEVEPWSRLPERRYALTPFSR
jgi:DNA polymerase-4